MTASVSNEMNFSGRTVVVVGGASGIGAATAMVCGSLGAKVVVADIQSTATVLEKLRQENVDATGHQLDMSSREDVESLAKEIGPVDAFVAAGAVVHWDDWLESKDWDANFDHQMHVNVLGPINLARVWMPEMIKRKSGNIVFISSLAGRTGGVADTIQPHYVASKGALNGVVRWLSRQAIVHGVNVNGVAPGPVDTPMNRRLTFNPGQLPMKRQGRPEELAWPIAFLLSRAASYISGVVLDVNGGTHVG